MGKDNEASGFNDQSRNLQSTPATTGPAGGTGNNGNNGNGTTPTTGTLNVCKIVVNTFSDYEPSDFTFTFTSEGAHPDQFAGSADCTKVTVPEGPYSFGEEFNPEVSSSGFDPSVSGDCAQDSQFGRTFSGSIKAGETQTCTVTNTITPF